VDGEPERLTVSICKIVLLSLAWLARLLVNEIVSDKCRLTGEPPTSHAVNRLSSDILRITRAIRKRAGKCLRHILRQGFDQISHFWVFWYDVGAHSVVL